MTNKALVDLAAQINGLRQQVETLSQPSLGYSSLEDGAIPEFDRAGGQVAQYGTQFDGSHMAASLSGPVPPIPSAPIVTPVAGGLMVRWDGEWADAAAIAPMDFSRVEVHVSTDPGFDRTSATFLRATIETPRGGDAVIVPLPYVEHTVALVARSLSGKSSVASVPVVGTPTKITQVDLDFDPGTLAGSTIYWGDEPTAPVEGDYWLQPPDNALTRWDGDSWEDVSDLGITEAIQAAAAAQGAADTASGQADAALAQANIAAGQAAQALTDAQTAQSIADGKANIYFQTSAPTGLVAADVNDLWIDSDDSNKAYVWDGDSWELAADQRIGTALANASTALTTATDAQTTATDASTTADAANTAVQTKITAYYQVSAPPTTGRTVGDLWIDIDDTNKVYRWDGTGSWVATPFGTNAISTVVPGQVSTGPLAPGTRWIAGNELGSHVEITDTGFYAYSEDPTDGTPDLSVRVGTTDNDLFAITDQYGNTMASISDNGVASFQKVYALEDPEISGSRLIGNFINYQSPTEQQDANPGLMDLLPRGVSGYGVYGNYTTLNGTMGLFEISFQAEPGRTYRITYSGNTFNIGAGAGINSGVMIRLVNPTWSADGIYEAPTPTFANGNVIGYSYAIGYSAARNITIPGRIWTLRCNPMGISAGGELNAGIVKLLFVIVAQVNMVLNGAEVMELVIEDIGPDIPSTRLLNNSTSTTGQTSQPTSKTYTTTWNSTNYATYRADGSKRTDTTDVIQGYSSFNGDGEGLWIFPSTIAGVLSGATVKKVEVYAYANHWYYNSGGTALIKVHGYTSEPATSPSMTTATSSANWPKPGGRWVTLPSSFWAGFKSGAYRGFGVGPAGSSNLLYYGRFNGSGAKLRITYTK
jgi:hypothetical protein